MLCWFPPNTTTNRTCDSRSVVSLFDPMDCSLPGSSVHGDIYAYPLPLEPPFPCSANRWAELPVLSSSSPSYFTHCSIYMSVLFSQFVPSSPSPAVSTSPFSMPTSLLLTCTQVNQYHCSRFHIYVSIYGTCFSLSDLFHSVWQTLSSSASPKWPNFIPFYGWVIFHCVYIPHLLYPFIRQWTSRLLPCLGYCK